MRERERRAGDGGGGMNAKTAADKNGSLGAGSEKQTRHQATGSVSLATKGLGEGSGWGDEGVRGGALVVSVYVCHLKLCTVTCMRMRSSF